MPYLADLGVSHLYCSPILQATTGSLHGYDVVDHGRISDDLGGAPGFTRLREACQRAGLGIVLDVVPNHCAVAAPESRNRAWWSVLRDGPGSPYARWFDIDWNSPGNPARVLVPILGAPLADSLDELELAADRIRYHDHEVPLAPGTRVAGDLLATLARQHYRLCHWRVAAEELNYRRFFDVTTLAGLRVEDPQVYAATHRLVLDQVRDGALDGLRVDHPDGLADPQGYLRRLAGDAPGCWIVVEKILERGERLPADWRCAGTTGYDALNLVTGLFVDPAGEAALTSLYAELTCEPAGWTEVVRAAKAYVVREVLAAEVSWLTRLIVRAAWSTAAGRDHTRRALREALEALLTGFDVYRAYVPPTGPSDPAATAPLDRARAVACELAPGRRSQIDLIADLVVHGPAELRVRFQQVCGPVMAKGVEDTAFYRYHRLVALNEVGGDPGTFGVSVAQFHQACRTAARDRPRSMTALSTHDTKRSEDVRARLVLLAQDPAGWAATCARLLALGERWVRPAGPDRGTIYLLLQTLVGVWPAEMDRVTGYLAKASREAKLHTSWTEPAAAYDDALAAYARGVLGDGQFTAALEGYLATLLPAADVTSRAQKLVQLTMPGVPDLYQGTESLTLSLVDPDNRRPVDYDALRASLAQGTDAKQRLVTRVLGVRRNHPEWFGETGGYQPVDAPDEAVAFLRAGQAMTVATRFPLSVTRRGGWAEALALPPGEWRDVLADRSASWKRSAPLADLLGPSGVALLVRHSEA